MSMTSALRTAVLLICTVLSAGEAGAEVPWHVIPPGTEYKSLAVPREPAAFVTLSYRRILGRGPTAEESARWLERLGSGEAKPDRVVTDLLASDEFFVRQSFMTLLGRPPGEGEMAARLQFLGGGGERRDIMRNLIESPEYRDTVTPPKR